MFIEGLFIIHRNWKQARCPSIEEWIKNMLPQCPTQWNTIQLFVKQDIMNFASKWMELEKIILSEVTQPQKNIHLYPIEVDISYKMQVPFYTPQIQRS